ncbi:hypothetical protein Clacol_000659 [Clathrus columnatus]|uniref:Uncharacterized protein n=1 Tax=Clathrus columnatus TaxID=1419009 RepID=A0AAV4ZX05_9AGAM|nr:hypothetical protein Clacol_000659 [Clathrus columnatus]
MTFVKPLHMRETEDAEFDEEITFVGNEHIVKPSSKDFEPIISRPRTTFPTPVPPFISRARPPLSTIPRRDPISANAGRYSLSLKGIRKRLRKAGPITEQIVFDIDESLTTWLQTGIVVLQPDISIPGASLNAAEISRSALQLIWRVEDDFPRFLVHCVARYYGIVSYSKTINEVGHEIRVTYLLRPNIARPDFKAASRLETPPTSDIDTLSITTETDNSESDALSDISDNLDDIQEGKIRNSSLATVPEEDSTTIGIHLESNNAIREDWWSEKGDDDEDCEALATNLESLSFKSRRSRIRMARGRRISSSVSSPSRSPRPLAKQIRSHNSVRLDQRSGFWNYVFG